MGMGSGSAEYCPWCVGEHQPEGNPGGSVHRDVTPSSPCMGTERGGATYTAERYGGQYAPFAGPGPASYTAGQSFEATIVLDADHNGEAQWQFCPHSQEETEECFRENPVSDWVDVHASWDSSNQEDHWKSGEHFSQTVTLSSGVPAGPGTLRWLWVCKYTDEIFLSCIDVNVASGAGDPQPAPAPAPAPLSSTTSHAPESCTAKDEDPYGSGSEVQCCDGLEKCLGDWSGNGITTARRLAVCRAVPPGPQALPAHPPAVRNSMINAAGRSGRAPRAVSLEALARNTVSTTASASQPQTRHHF